MIDNEQNPTRRHRHALWLFAVVILLLTASSLAGCDGSAGEPETVDRPRLAADYAPAAGDGWQVSTPAEQGLDPARVRELYDDAAGLERLYGLLVVKNGYLVAEQYFNEGSVEQKARIQSATKSIASALVGIALDQGCLASVKQKMLDSFPEVAGRITDPRKAQITIRQMRNSRSLPIRAPSSSTAT